MRGIYIIIYILSLLEFSPKTTLPSLVYAKDYVIPKDACALMNGGVEKFHVELSKKEQLKLINILKTSHNYLEFGSGGSTFLALITNNELKVTSVESDRFWIKHLKKWKIINKNIKEKRLNILYINIGEVIAWGYPKNKSSKSLFPYYSSRVFSEVKGEEIDTVFIDGRFRVACALGAVIYCPKSLIIVHDYPNRKQYHVIEKFLDKISLTDTLAIFKVKENINLHKVKNLYNKYKYIAD